MYYTFYVIYHNDPLAVKTLQSARRKITERSILSVYRFNLYRTPRLARDFLDTINGDDFSSPHLTAFTALLYIC